MDSTTLQGLRVVSQFVEPDELFASLDGQQIAVDGKIWRAEVYSISDVDGSRWIQLGLTGRINHMIALKVNEGDGVKPALSALSAKLSTRVSMTAQTAPTAYAALRAVRHRAS